jgi:OFA family oxalate/formate antiporter-like MFS transporter
MSNTNRWGIAAAGFLMQMALGAVYAWSVFRIPLAKQFHWSIEEVTFTFTVSIFVLGVACFFGGLWLNRKGPRVVALTGGFLYGLGVFLASFSANKLMVALFELWSYRRNRRWIRLYRSHCSAGEVVSRSKGLITGIAVGGFGAGALVTAPVATRLIQSVGVLQTFAYLGIAYLVITMAHWLFHAESARGVEAGRLGPNHNQDQTTCGTGLHARRRS